MKPDRITSYIGLAMKAGRIASGEYGVEKSVKEGRAALVILSADASGNTKKKFSDMCRYYGVPVFVYKSKEELGHMIGKEQRACLAVEDAGFAKAILALTEENTGETGVKKVNEYHG